MGRIFQRDGISKLSLSYMPEKLPHREEHVDEMTMLFAPMAEGIEQVPWAVMVVGPSGTGKTAVVRRSLSLIESKSRAKAVRLRTEYLNCRFAISDYALLQMLALRLIPGISSRGYSTTELLQAIQEYLSNRKEKILIALDDFDSFLRSVGRKTSVIYDVLKGHEGGKGSIFLILAGVEDFSVYFEESWIRNYIWRTKTSYVPYEYDQMRDVLQSRTQHAFFPGTINEDDLLIASRMATKFGYGSARYGLELMLAAGREADWENSETVAPEHFRIAQTRMEGVIEQAELRKLSSSVIGLLKKVANASASKERAYFQLSELGIVKEEEIAELRKLDFEGIVDILEEKGQVKVALLGMPAKGLTG